MLQRTALNPVQNIARFRPEFNAYILIAQEQKNQVVEALIMGTSRLALAHCGRFG